MVQARPLLLAILPALVLLWGCTAADRDTMAYKAKNAVTQDREMDWNRDDFRKAMAGRDAGARPESAIPELAPVITEDRQNILPQPLVSVTVNQDVSLRDIFFELAQQ